MVRLLSEPGAHRYSRFGAGKGQPLALFQHFARAMDVGQSRAVVAVMEHDVGQTPDSFDYQRHTSDVLMVVLIFESHL
jgi:hypothetical protein